MALVVSVMEGDSFFVGKHNSTEVVVKEVISAQNFKLEVKQPTMNHIYTVTNRFKVEILPQVFVSAGIGSSFEAKIVVEAPRHIPVVRAALLRRDGDHRVST